jgi:hypothetical protein
MLIVARFPMQNANEFSLLIAVNNFKVAVRTFE